MQNLRLTKCELEVMDVVWKRGSATVQDVVDSLARSLAYTTVMTTLKILDETRKVVRRKKQGRAYLYEPVVTREEVAQAMASDLTESLFHGSVASMMLGLIETGSISKSDLKELKSAITVLEQQS